MTNIEIKPAALSIEEAQKICGCRRTKMYELLKSGALPARKLGRRTLILRSDLDRFLENLAVYPTKKADIRDCGKGVTKCLLT